MRTNNRWLSRVAVIMMMLLALATTIFATGEEAEAVSSFYNTFYYFVWCIIATHCINNNSHMYILLCFSI